MDSTRQSVAPVADLLGRVPNLEIDSLDYWETVGCNYEIDARTSETMEIPTSVLQLTDSIRLQSDIVTSISGAGVGFILFTLARVLGLASDINLTGFRRPKLLAVPLALFLIAFVLGYVLSASLSGYFAEVVSRVDSSSGMPITDARQHFNCQYFVWLQAIGGVQLLCNVLGILALSGWFVVNVWSSSSSSNARMKTP